MLRNRERSPQKEEKLRTIKALPMNLHPKKLAKQAEKAAEQGESLVASSLGIIS